MFQLNKAWALNRNITEEQRRDILKGIIEQNRKQIAEDNEERIE